MKTQIINGATSATFGTVHLLATATARIAERAEANVKSFSLGENKEDVINLRRQKTDNRLASAERALDKTTAKADRLRSKMAAYLPKVEVTRPEAFKKPVYGPENKPEPLILV